ncbi:adhesion G-protein coupled receptor F3 [Onychostoma macrolepis]|uniref:Uncharacterized protein n=1 Tax=Onychostoma macrolepis TaxID=369639 RepID=A0A7J6C3R8_9TELE|nr:adhesion G-protein coupled receptor F3 [Onychostoma macrolepis]XP_058604373.1 adhesion G-protein coupled receptor F3 [Onychostoma macrolepis]XP_058604374.1 adhesion G-protein coupled receptor F3 [Onychostoma macrolepis]KAF4101917.1 hypothetical protein G5714_016717 [Onychostoma macrolepis]
MKLSKGVILLFLGLFFKVAVAENSTQVYWLELEIESSLYDNFTKLLQKLPQININKATVTDISITTDCKWHETHKKCWCKSNYTGTEDMCKNDKCCNENCTQKLNDIAVCLPESRVSINGLTALNESCEIVCDPSQKGSSKYQEENIRITSELAKQYSKLKYFDSLVITNYRSGSVIAYYTVQLMSSVPINDLTKIASELAKSNLVTTGIITIKGLHNKTIDIGSSTSITCTRPTDLENATLKWYLTNTRNKTTEITVGQEANFTNSSLMNTANLINISGSWKGTIKCVYTSGSIDHTASTELDIALLPEIQAMSNPQFPNCKDTKSKIVVVECKISADAENYTVTWNNTSFKQKDPEIQGNIISYKAERTIYCSEPNNETIYIACTFTNNRASFNKFTTKNVEIPIILPDSKVCKENGVWPITKSGYEAFLYCGNSGVGLKKRWCKSEVWEKEISTCVNEDLHGIKKDIEILNKGIGLIKNDADELFKRIKHSTSVETFSSFANINESIVIFQAMNNVSIQQSNQWNDTVIPDFVSSISNALNDTDVWTNPENGNKLLSVTYLKTIEGVIKQSNLTSDVPQTFKNVELVLCNNTCGGFDANITSDNKVVVTSFRNLNKVLPEFDGVQSKTTVVSVNPVNDTKKTGVKLMFQYSKKRLRNHEMNCVFLDENNNTWSSKGCKWGGAENPELCSCDHNSAFTIMMSRNAETLLYMTELTYAGLGISIVSLVLCLIIEFLVWDAVVKSDISNFRHVALVNISLCLLFAHCAFLASSDPKKISQNWCSILTVTKHFFFLAVFFWMLCLSVVLLHQMIFVFDQLRKKVFLVLSITVGYVCPLICVATTYITFENGKPEEYYSTETCWLIYQGVLKGSLFSFVIPALTIVMVNLFTLVVVIMKIVSPTVSDSKARDQKDVAKAMIKTIVFLSPVLGITWLLGILVLHLDLTQKPFAQIVSYAFTLFNSLQGFLILLTNCLGEKKVCDALLKRFQSKKSRQSKSESSSKATSSVTTK